MSDILLESSALVANVQVIIQSHVTWPTSNINHFKLDTSPPLSRLLPHCTLCLITTQLRYPLLASLQPVELSS